MKKRILIIDGNPARERQTFTAALVHAYSDAAQKAGHDVRKIAIAALNFDPILHEGYHGHQDAEPDLAGVQSSILWSQHLVFIYPMWQFGIPALLKGFCERIFTPGFAYAVDAKNPMDAALLKGRSVRLVQTMGMPGAFYWLAFGAHGGQAFKSMFAFCGCKPVRLTVLGMVEGGETTRTSHLAKLAVLGRQGN